MPVEQYGPSVFSLTIDNEEKDIPLKTFSDKARDKWTKSIGDAVVQYARSKKKDIRLQRSKLQHHCPIAWSDGHYAQVTVCDRL